MLTKSWAIHATGILKVFSILIVVYSCIVLTFFFQPDLIVELFFQSEGISSPSFEPKSYNLPGHNFYINSNNGMIPIWVLGNNIKTAEEEESKKFSFSQQLVVFLLHGIKYNRYDSRKIKVYKYLIDMGAVVVTLDYKGFSEYIGDSNGNAAIEDVITVYKWLEEQYDERVYKVWWGHSAGCGIAVEALLRGKFEVDHLIFESGFASIKSLMINKTPFKMLFGWWMPFSFDWIFKPVLERSGLMFDNVNGLQKVKSHIYHVHSYYDRVVPIEEALMINNTMSRSYFYHPVFTRDKSIPESHYISTHSEQLIASLFKDIYKIYPQQGENE
ncbi:unnamed protein product [Auanema sp. JU1783]|nr:unnamed protein product [Auanema sp. JU1783]